MFTLILHETLNCLCICVVSIIQKYSEFHFSRRFFDFKQKKWKLKIRKSIKNFPLLYCIVLIVEESNLIEFYGLK